MKNKKENEKVFIVDLTSVSFYNEQALLSVSRSEEYRKIPFLYMTFSYIRNGAMAWADDRLNYIGKSKKGDWVVYCFK